MIKDCLVCLTNSPDVRKYLEWAIRDGCDEDHGDEDEPDIAEDLFEHIDDVHYEELKRMHQQVEVFRKKRIEEAMFK